jgi:hypothetical protein
MAALRVFVALLLRHEAFHKLRIELSGDEIRVRENALVQRNRGIDTLHDEHIQSATHPGKRIRAILSVDNQLCNHRVIIRRHHATLILRRIHADAGSAGYVEDGDLACRGGEFLGMLGVDAALDSMSPGSDGLGDDVR